MAVKIRLSEKKILHNAVLFARTLRETLLSQPLAAGVPSLNGGLPSVAMQTAGSTAGAANSVPVIVEVNDDDENGGEPEAAPQSTRKEEEGVTNILDEVVELDDDKVSGDTSGGELEPEVTRQPLGGVGGATDSVPIVVELENGEETGKKGGLLEPKENVSSEQSETVIQVNGKVGNKKHPTLCEGEREGTVSDSVKEGERERKGRVQKPAVVVGSKDGANGEVGCQGRGCCGDEGGGRWGIKEDWFKKCK